MVDPSMVDEKARNLGELFQAVGAVVVAGGQVEWHLQRVLRWLRGQGPDFSPDIARMSWTDLASSVQREASVHVRASEIAALFQTSDEQRLKTIRDNVVHTFWWTHGGVGLRGNRISRRGAGSVLVGNFEDLRQAAAELFAFAERLEKIVPETDWPLAHTID